MIGSRKPDEILAAQFEPDGDGFLYRPNLAAPGIRVTLAERERFVYQYRRRFRVLTWSAAGVMLLAIFAAMLPIFGGSEHSTPDTLVIVVPIVAGLIGVNVWCSERRSGRSVGDRQPHLGAPRLRPGVSRYRN
jgi:hypothetical protein